jgi:recombination endonuclease VII
MVMGYWDDMEQKAPDSKSDAARVADQMRREVEIETLRKAWAEELLRLELRKQHAARKIEDARRLRLYDLSVVEHRNLLAQQNGVCAICREPGDPLCVDHDHRTGRVRSLLCGHCNSAIGFLRESPLLARAAATYLELQLTKEFTGE